VTERWAERNIPKLLARARIPTSAAKGNRFDVTGPDGDRKGTFKSLKVATAALARVAGWQTVLKARFPSVPPSLEN
jgi:hypothetical protein